MLALSLALTAALVVEDRVPLRAAVHETAARQAVLFRGDWLEVLAERAGYLQVWDHRRERPGYVRIDKVREFPVEEASAPALRALVGFLRDAPGSESLGIACAALWLRASPAAAADSDLFDALGTMAERLARRASSVKEGPGDAATAAHLEVAQSWGVGFRAVEREGRALACYDGDAFRRVLALGGSARARQRAALALTDDRCDPVEAIERSPIEQRAEDERRLAVLDQVDAATLPPWLAGPLRLRRAAVLARLAYDDARAASRGEPDERAKARAASERAVKELAGVARAELTDEEAPLYDEAAVRVAASRWAAEPDPPSPRPLAAGLSLALAPGRPGETCVRLLAKGRADPAYEHCTYGLPWPASARASTTGDAVAIAVQPMAGWVELWLLRRDRDGWRFDALAPAPADPGLGYVELAGFAPDGSRLLVAREAWVGGALLRRFEVLRADTLAVEKFARSSPDLLAAFARWAAPSWRTRTLAVR